MIRDQSGSGCSAAFLAAFGAVFGGFGAAFVVGIVVAAVVQNIPLLVFAAVIPAVFVFVGWGLLALVARGAWLRRALGAPVLVLPAGEPLGLGNVVVARFQRSGGTRQAHSTARLAAELICEEKATYRQGTDNHTVTREIHRRELAVRVDPTPNPVSGQVRIVVPVGVPPSMSLPRNEIVWTVRVKVQVADLPDGTGTFPVTVLPVVASRLPGTGGPAAGPAR